MDKNWRLRVKGYCSVSKKYCVHNFYRFFGIVFVVAKVIEFRICLYRLKLCYLCARFSGEIIFIIFSFMNFKRRNTIV